MEVVSVNVAVTLVAAFIVTVQVPETGHPPPDHPAKVDPLAGVAVSVTTVPALKPVLAPVQAGPQLMPLGDDVTVPLPVPDFERVSA